MTEFFFLKFSLFYLAANEEIQSGKIQNNQIFFFNFPAPFSAEFPHSQEKKSRKFKKISVVLYLIFIHTLGFLQ